MDNSIRLSTRTYTSSTHTYGHSRHSKSKYQFNIMSHSINSVITCKYLSLFTILCFNTCTNRVYYRGRKARTALIRIRHEHALFFLDIIKGLYCFWNFDLFINGLNYIFAKLLTLVWHIVSNTHYIYL